MADARAKDIQLSKKDCITLENKNRTLFEGNKEVALAIRAAKQERQDIENDIEAVEDIIARNVQMLRAKEKENR
jgi:acid phosphatase class B